MASLRRCGDHFSLALSIRLHHCQGAAPPSTLSWVEMDGQNQHKSSKLVSFARALFNAFSKLHRPEGPSSANLDSSDSLTLHDSENERLLGFDNAHPIRQDPGPGAPDAYRI